MSEEATRAVVARWFGALDAGNVDAAMACLADNVRWINSPAQEGKPGGIPGLSAIIPWLGDFSNKADVIATFGPWGQRQETVRYERLNMMFRDDQALVLVHEVARIRATGLIYDVEFVQRIQVAGDFIVMLRAYWDTSQAVAAFRGDMPARVLAAAKQGNTDEAELVLPFGANPNQADPVSADIRLDDRRRTGPRRDGEDAPFVRSRTEPDQPQVGEHRSSQCMPNRQAAFGQSTSGSRRVCRYPAADDGRNSSARSAETRVSGMCGNPHRGRCEQGCRRVRRQAPG